MVLRLRDDPFQDRPVRQTPCTFHGAAKNPKERKNARSFGRRKEGDLAETNVVVGEEQLQQQKQWFQVAGFFVIPLGESGVVGW